MDELQKNNLDALLVASLFRNVSAEAEEFLKIDVRGIKDNPGTKRKVLRLSDRRRSAKEVQVLRVTVAVCLILISAAFTACMCIPEVRESMWNALVGWYDDHIRVAFTGKNIGQTDNEGNGASIKAPASIEKRAVAAYLPNGYYAEENETTVFYADTFFYDADGNMKFSLLQHVIDTESGGDAMIDNESDPVKTVYVNGNEGILVEYTDEPGLYFLIWQDTSYQYSLYGSFASADELLKIAEGIG